MLWWLSFLFWSLTLHKFKHGTWYVWLERVEPKKIVCVFFKNVSKLGHLNYLWSLRDINRIAPTRQHAIIRLGWNSFSSWGSFWKTRQSKHRLEVQCSTIIGHRQHKHLMGTDCIQFYSINHKSAAKKFRINYKHFLVCMAKIYSLPYIVTNILISLSE